MSDSDLEEFFDATDTFSTLDPARDKRSIHKAAVSLHHSHHRDFQIESLLSPISNPNSSLSTPAIHNLTSLGPAVPPDVSSDDEKEKARVGFVMGNLIERKASHPLEDICRVVAQRYQSKESGLETKVGNQQGMILFPHVYNHKMC
jgi:hypothetical protein